MYQRLPRYAPILLVLMIATAAGCERLSDPPTSPAAGSEPAQSITAEPAVAVAEFLPGGSCFARPAFAVRIWLRVHGGFFIRGLRFHFLDDFGARTLPIVTSIPTPSGTQIPSSSPVPVPGIAGLPTPFPAGGSSPFIVHFGCGVIPDGTLFITADHDRGTTGMKIRISGR